MEDNGVFLQCIDGGVLEAVRRGRGCSGRGGRCSAVCRGNHPVGGAGGGLEELTVQDKKKLLLP